MWRTPASRVGGAVAHTSVCRARRASGSGLGSARRDDRSSISAAGLRACGSSLSKRPYLLEATQCCTLPWRAHLRALTSDVLRRYGTVYFMCSHRLRLRLRNNASFDGTSLKRGTDWPLPSAPSCVRSVSNSMLHVQYHESSSSVHVRARHARTSRQSDSPSLSERVSSNARVLGCGGARTKAAGLRAASGQVRLPAHADWYCAARSCQIACLTSVGRGTARAPPPEAANQAAIREPRRDPRCARRRRRRWTGGGPFS